MNLRNRRILPRNRNENRKSHASPVSNQKKKKVKMVALGASYVWLRENGGIASRIKTTSRCHPPGFRVERKARAGGFCSIPAILGPDNAAYIRAGIKRLHHQIAPPSRASIRYTALSFSLSLSLEHPLSLSTPRIVFPPFASCLLAELSSFSLVATHSRSPFINVFIHAAYSPRSSAILLLSPWISHAHRVDHVARSPPSPSSLG